MIIDCISDLHGEYPVLEGGDLLIVAGDLVGRSDLGAYTYFCNWLNRQDYKKKVVIAGNHDTYLQENSEFFHGQTGIDYLCDSFTEFEGLKIYGSPWTHRFQGINPHCCAFAVTSRKLENKMKAIPYKDIDILVTHCPPYGIFDSVKRYKSSGVGIIMEEFYDHTGSFQLRQGVFSSDIKLHVFGHIHKSDIKLHVFGHIHENGGKVIDCVMTKFVNASLMDENYEFVNKPVRIEL